MHDITTYFCIDIKVSLARLNWKNDDPDGSRGQRQVSGIARAVFFKHDIDDIALSLRFIFCIGITNHFKALNLAYRSGL